MTISRVYMICNSYESGYGHGLANDGLDLSKTPHADAEQGEAYQTGYEAGQANMNNDSNTTDFYKKELHKWQAIAAERLGRIVKLRKYLNSDGYHSSSYDETCPVCKLLKETEEDT